MDRALAHVPSVEHVIVFSRTEMGAEMQSPRDIAWNDALAARANHEAVPVPAEHPLFILYTSGTTG